MIWILVVLILALVWVLIRQNRPIPAPRTEKELPDPQDLLANRFSHLAAEARGSNRHSEAQVLELKVAWLKTRPLLGHDEPPAVLDANEQKHLRLAADLWGRYSQLLSDDNQAFAACQFRPQSSLPYPKEYLALALDLLVDVGEGRIQSMHVNSKAVQSDVIVAMKGARARLDGFVDVSADELPTDPTENSKYGAERGWSARGA
jgi:hypothetical protein